LTEQTPESTSIGFEDFERISQTTMPVNTSGRQQQLKRKLKKSFKGSKGKGLFIYRKRLSLKEGNLFLSSIIYKI